MAEERVQRRLAAILAADVSGYSRLMEADEEDTLARMKRLQKDVIDPKIAEYGGRIFKTTGDGLLAEFASAVDAVRHAIDVQRAMAQLNADVPEDRRIAFRIGISLGDVMVDGDDLFGNGVNVAARMEGLAEPGGISVSGNVQEHIGNSLDVDLEDLGEQTVKNLERPVRCYRVHLDAATVSPIVEQLDSPPALPDKPSIAVLPFENISGDPEQEYFSDGICEDIITALSRIRFLFVAARNSSFSYKGQSANIRQVAAELGVRYVLEGSVRKAGNRVRITAQLIEGASGNHLWAERYDHSLEDIFDVQDQITATVVGTLQPELGKAERDRAKAKRTEDLDAWDAFQRGMWHTYRRTRDDLLTAVEYFDKSIALEPGFASAHWGKAICYFYTVNFGLEPAREEVLEKALEAARQGVALDPDDSMAHTALGFVHLARRDSAAAQRACQTAIEIDPNNYIAPRVLGISLVASGKAAEGLPYLETSLRLSPRDPLASGTLNYIAAAHFFMGEYETGLDWALRGMRNRQAPQTWVVTTPIAILGHLGRQDEARQMLAELEEIHSGITCAFVRDNIPISDPAYLEIYIDGLRKAGLPE